MKLDTDLNASYLAPMIKPRWFHSTALMRDRFIFVMGGQEVVEQDPVTTLEILKVHMTYCECYDTKTNTWFTIDSLLPSAACHLSVVTFADRYVYSIPMVNNTDQTI